MGNSTSSDNTSHSSSTTCPQQISFSKYGINATNTDGNTYQCYMKSYSHSGGHNTHDLHCNENGVDVWRGQNYIGPNKGDKVFAGTASNAKHNEICIYRDTVNNKDGGMMINPKQ